MATVTEEQYGRRLSNRRASRVYLVTGTADEATARAAVIAEKPATVDGLQYHDTEVTEIKDVEPSHWLGFVEWREGRFVANENLADPGDEVYDFDTSGATQHIVQSLATRDSDAVAGTATDQKGAIGVSGKGATRSVAGVDIVVPQFSFSVTRVMATADVNTAFTQML